MQSQALALIWRKPIIQAGALLLCLLCLQPSTRAQSNYAFQFAIGGTVNNPQGLAIDAEDNLYVADTGNNRIVKYSPTPYNSNLSFIGKIGTTGNHNGQFSDPTAVAVDSFGNIYVADSSNDRIQKFDSTGKWVWTVGGYGTGNGKFQHPTGIAVDSSGNVWVADTSNNRVQEFNSKGVYLNQFGSPGSGNTNFSSPSSVAVDTINGTVYVYVLDTGNGALKQFTSAGTWIWTIGGFNDPQGLTVDTNTHYVYVADTENGRVMQYGNNGNYIRQIGSHWYGGGQFANDFGVAVDSSGDLFVTDFGNVSGYTGYESPRIAQFDGRGDYLGQFGQIGDPFNSPYGVGVDSSLGTINIADAGDHRVKQFDSQGDYLRQFGSYWYGSGNFVYDIGLAVNSSGDIYVTDYGNVSGYTGYDNQLQKFDSLGNPIWSIDNGGSGNAQFSNPYYIALDSSSNVYVADQANNRIEIFDSNGNYKAQFGSQGTGKGQFQNPTGVAVDSAGNIYVTDYSNYRIQKFNNKYVWQWSVGTLGTGLSQFQQPTGIAVDAANNVYVCDSGSNRIKKFDTNGKFITELSVDGWGDAYASQVASLTVDSDGTLYVTETTNNRVVVLEDLSSAAPTLTGLSPDQATVGSPSFTLTVNGTNFGSNASINIAGKALPTSWISTTQLSATVPSSLLTAAKTVPVTVSNPAGGGTSNALFFNVVYPVPTLTSITPDKAVAGSSATQITLKGNQFVSTSTVTFGGTVLTPSHASSTQLTLTIPAAQLTTTGVVNVSVTNPTPGGGVSNTLAFVIGANPVPSVSSLSPNQAIAGSAATLLTVNGANFVNGATILFNSKALATTFVSDMQLTATIPASQLANVGTFSVSVMNPRPGGGNSDSLTFTVANSTPVLTGVSPAQVTVGASDTTITLTGSGFTAGSTAQFNGVNLTTTYASSTQLTAVIPAAQLTTAGNYYVTVNTAAPGGGTSASVTFSVLNGVPTLSSLSPAQAKAGSAALALAVNGSGFVKGAVVSFGAAKLVTQFVSATQVKVTIPANLLTKAGMVNVIVTNPAPGGGDSDPLTFTIH